MKARQYETNWSTEWECPECDHRERRHPNAKNYPFCDPCEHQFAVLIEMKPIADGERVTLNE